MKHPIKKTKPGTRVKFVGAQRFYERGNDDTCSSLGGVEIVKPMGTLATIVRWGSGRCADKDKLLVRSDDGMLSWCWWDQVQVLDCGKDRQEAPE